MAVFVMAVGILAMVALFPLGLREGMQARGDVKQSMFADHVLNQFVALLSDTNLTWSQWAALDQTAYPKATDIGGGRGRGSIAYPKANLPFPFKDPTIGWKSGTRKYNENQYRVFFRLTGGAKLEKEYQKTLTPSARVMGIGVRSTERNLSDYNDYSNNVLYYAEVQFRGDPNR